MTIKPQDLANAGIGSLSLLANATFDGIERLAELIAQHTGQSVETIEADSDRDRWFTADDAKSYGLIDAVIRADK